jgi:hypothetical protein
MTAFTLPGFTEPELHPSRVAIGTKAHTLPGFESAVGIIIPTEGAFRAEPGSGAVGPSYIGAEESPLMKWAVLSEHLRKVYREAGMPVRYETEQDYLDAIRSMPAPQVKAIVEAMGEVEKLGYLSDIQKRHLELARQELAYRQAGGKPPTAERVVYVDPVWFFGEKQPEPAPEKKKGGALGLWLLGGLVVVGVGVAVFAGGKKTG